MSIKLSNAAGIAALQAIIDLVESGNKSAHIVVYQGDEPSSAEQSLSDPTVPGHPLIVWPLDSLPFGTPYVSGGAAHADLPSAEGTSIGNRQAAYFRLWRVDYTAGVQSWDGHVQGLVGTSASDLNLPSLTVTSGATYTLADFQLSLSLG